MRHCVFRSRPFRSFIRKEPTKSKTRLDAALIRGPQPHKPTATTGLSVAFPCRYNVTLLRRRRDSRCLVASHAPPRGHTLYAPFPFCAALEAIVSFIHRSEPQRRIHRIAADSSLPSKGTMINGKTPKIDTNAKSVKAASALAVTKAASLPGRLDEDLEVLLTLNQTFSFEVDDSGQTAGCKRVTTSMPTRRWREKSSGCFQGAASE